MDWMCMSFFFHVKTPESRKFLACVSVCFYLHRVNYIYIVRLMLLTRVHNVDFFSALFLDC